MWGAKFWGRRFWGKKYWGPAAEGETPAPLPPLSKTYVKVKKHHYTIRMRRR
jgi:hypothetical protein